MVKQFLKKGWTGFFGSVSLQLPFREQNNEKFWADYSEIFREDNGKEKITFGNVLDPWGILTFDFPAIKAIGS